MDARLRNKWLKLKTTQLLSKIQQIIHTTANTLHPMQEMLNNLKILRQEKQLAIVFFWL